MTAYKDLGKETRDILDQNFLFGSSITISGQLKTDNGFVFKETLKRTLKKDTKKPLGGAPSQTQQLSTQQPKTTATTSSGLVSFIETVFEPKYEIADHLEINGKISSTSEYSGSFIYKDFLTRGTKFEVNTTKTDKEVIGKLETSYKTPSVVTSTVTTYPLFNKKTVSPSSIKVLGDLALGVGEKHFCGLAVGVDIDSFRKRNVNLKTEAAFSQVTKDHQVTTRVSYLCKDEGLSWYFGFLHKFTNTLTWALGYELDFVKGRSLILAFENKMDQEKTMKVRTVIKNDGTGSPDWRLGLSLKQKVGSFATFVVATDFNIRHFTGDITQGGEGHSFGLSLKLE